MSSNAVDWSTASYAEKLFSEANSMFANYGQNGDSIQPTSGYADNMKYFDPRLSPFDERRVLSQVDPYGTGRFVYSGAVVAILRGLKDAVPKHEALGLCEEDQLNGTISLLQFVHLIRNLKRNLSEREVREAIDLVDRDRLGVVTFNNFVRWLYS